MEIFIQRPLRDSVMFDGSFDLAILSGPLDLTSGKAGFGSLVMRLSVFVG